jgi:hypothetical protein
MFLAAALAALVVVAPPDLLTTAEKTAFERTGRYDEVVRLCRTYERTFPRRARCFSFGTTPEGRELVALAASADGLVRPLAARTKGRPVVVIQGAIHAGELDGKDAGFMLLRELLASADGGPLARVTAVFIPVLNADGHERFGPNQRPNQRGPAELGWRTTARNHDLNRDYTKADAPETRAVLALLAEWDPIVYADLHVTDGAQFEHDLAVMVEPRFGYDPALRAEGRALSDALISRLEAQGHLPLDFYPAFATDGDPASGFSHGVPSPRFGTGYWAAHNRFGVLLEAHSWRPYAERVKGAIDFSRALLELAADHGVRWTQAAARADRAGAGLAGKEVALAFGAAPEVPGSGPAAATPRSTASEGRAARTLRFRGFAYRRETSVVTGRPVVSYDESRPQIWEVPLREDVRPTVTAVLPRGGWIVPAAWAGVLGPKLKLHGVLSSPVTARRSALPVEVFRAKEAAFAATSFEGRQTLTVKGAWEPETRDVTAGALFVPAAQARALLAAHLLEPAGPDAFLSWGELNGAFEPKEYIEDYVLEPFARELLAKDALFRAEFERRLRDDPAFAGDPQARSELFHRRHPSFDAAYRVYPILRTAARP